MVSVIIPAYNAEKYLKKCLESISAQSYDKLQVIVVDDGSKDETLKVANEYAANDPRVTVIHKENGGVSSARNLALRSVKGEYIFFMDADDVIETNAIEVLVKAIEDTGSDWVNCQYSRWDENWNRLEDYNFIKGIFNLSSEKERVSFATDQLLPYYVGFEVWDKLFKSEIILNNNITFSEKCRIGEDLAFNIKYLMHTGRINCIEDRCIRYMIRGDSAMGGHKELSGKINENVLLLEDVYSYAKSSQNQCFIEEFPLICARILDNSYLGNTPADVINALPNVVEADFLAEMYGRFSDKKDGVLGLYPDAIAKIKYRYHMYVYGSMKGYSIKDKLEMSVYDLYRRAKKRPILKDWKMPY